MDPTFPLVPIANFLACILVLMSLSKGMFRHWNVGVCSFAIWVAIVSLYMAVNAIVWADNVENKAPIWCDITTHLGVGSDVAIPAASFVIIRRLSIIVRGDNRLSVAMEKLNLLVDLFFCVGCPLIQMILYYVVQANRFTILEEVGCLGSAINAGSTIVVFDSASMLFPLASLILYSPKLIKAYFSHNRDLDALSSNTVFNRHGFIRVLALGLFDIFVTLPIGVLDLIVTISEDGITGFWPGWKAAHAEFSSIPTATSEEWRSAGFWTIFDVKLTEWTNPVYALVFFVLFGLTSQKRAQYRNAFSRVMKLFGFTPRVDQAASDIIFGSSPVVNSGVGTTRATRITFLSSAFSNAVPDRRDSFSNVAEIEEARLDTSGTETVDVSISKESLTMHKL